jgi:type III secretory pathway component EscT
MNSYQILPADSLIANSFFLEDNPFWQTLTKLLTTFTALAVQLAAPSFLAILMTETFLGIANRLAQQVQIAFLGMALKSLAGIALLWASWFFVLKQLGKQTLIWFQDLDRLLNWIPS